MSEMMALRLVFNLHGVKLPAKTFRGAAKTGITAPTFIRAMCATQVKAHHLRLKCKEEAERVTCKQFPVRVCYKAQHPYKDQHAHCTTEYRTIR